MTTPYAIPNRAMLLAAGLGSRLRPLTDRLPKCMVPVAGKPVLRRNVEWLRAWGVADLTVNLHHCPEAVTAHFGDGSGLGVRIGYSHEPELLGTAGALDPVRDLFAREPFWVVYADNLIDCDLGAMQALHVALGAALTMALFWRADVGGSGVAVQDGEGRIVAFREKPSPGEVDSHWVFAGLLLCEPRVLDYIPRSQPCDFGHHVLPAMLAAGERLAGYRMGDGEGLWWIDRPEDLKRVKDEWGAISAHGRRA